MPSEGPQQPGEQAERQPVTFEGILGEARRMKESKVKGDPLDPESPQFEALQRTIDAWRVEHGLHLAGVGSVEKANDIVRCARLWIDAGYTAPKFRRAAIETLGDEHAVALAEGSEDVTKVLADALTAIESGLSDKKEMVPAIASEKISEALRLAQEGRAKDAIGILTLAIFDPRIKRLPKSIRDQIVQLRDKIKAESTS